MAESSVPPASSATPRRPRHRAGGLLRAVPLAGVAAALSVALIALGVSGTLSSWTVAILHNSNNTVATGKAVILSETSGAANCLSTSGAGATNEFTCATIDKFGGTTSPLTPGGTQSATVVMANNGSTPGTLKFQGTGCTSAGGVSVGRTDSCGVLTVSVACGSTTPYSTVYPTTGTATLTQFAAASATTISTNLAAGASITCTFTVSLPSTASPTAGGQTDTGTIDWTLTAN